MRLRKLLDIPIEIKVLGISFLTVLSILLALAVGYFYYGFSAQDTRLGLLGIGVLANLLLVSAYILSVTEDYRMKERAERTPLHSNVIEDILDPAIETIYTNRRMIMSGKAPWMGSGINQDEPKNVTIAEDFDYSAQDWFIDEQKEIMAKIDTHNFIMEELRQRNCELGADLRDPVEDKLLETQYHSEYEVVQGVIDLLLSDVYIAADPSQLNQPWRDIWSEHYRPLIEARDEHVEGDLSDLQENLEDYQDLSAELLDDLVQLKEEMRREMQTY